MTDRELLELAAKAAQIMVNPWHEKYGLLLSDFDFEPWNPLTDDGDALRLAVKLGIGTEVWKGQAWAWKDGAKNEPIAIEELGDDPYVATRRAIVCAAAEIGRMK